MVNLFDWKWTRDDCHLIPDVSLQLNVSYSRVTGCLLLLPALLLPAKRNLSCFGYRPAVPELGRTMAFTVESYAEKIFGLFVSIVV